MNHQVGEECQNPVSQEQMEKLGKSKFKDKETQEQRRVW